MNRLARRLTVVTLAGWLLFPLPLGGPLRAQPATPMPASLAHSSATRPVPLESSVLLWSRSDYERAAATMRRVIGYGCRRVNVVVTLQCEVRDDDGLSSLGIGDVRRAGRNNYVPLTSDVLDELEQGLRAGFAEAVTHHVDLVILTHLDSNGRRDRWRNYFRFDPAEPMAEFSYEQAMLQMVISALDVTKAQGIAVECNLTGEMGTTIFGHADKYLAILHRLRAQRPDVRFGFNLNHGGIEGERPPTLPECQAVQALIDACDFIGFSNYRPVGVPPRPEDFEKSVLFFVSELSRLRLALPPDLPLHFSEVGLGGAAAEGEDSDVRAVAATPYAGPRYGAASPWKVPELRELRRQYHAALLAFLARPTGPQPVTAAFLWSHATWDPLNQASPDNFDETIFEAIRRHNERAYAFPRRGSR